MPAEYCVELFDSDPTWGPATRRAEIWDARNLGWSRYDRIPGKAFFTLYATSPLAPKVKPLRTHVKLWRLTPNSTTNVYSGAVIDYDQTGDDTVFSCFDYLALLSISRTGYKTLYPKKFLGSDIVAAEWALAKGASQSPLGFVTTGTIEDPLGNDGTTKIQTNNQFGLLDQMRLQLFYDLSEMGRANTYNHVSFNVSRTAPYSFNFLADDDAVSKVGFVLGGNVSDFHFLPNWTSYRNDLATIGTTTGGGATEIVVTDESSATGTATYARRQDVFTLKTLAGIVGKATEADQQQAASAFELLKHTDLVPALQLKLLRGQFDPFIGNDINNQVPVEVPYSIENLPHIGWRLVGMRSLYTEAGEDMSVIVEPSFGGVRLDGT